MILMTLQTISLAVDLQEQLALLYSTPRNTSEFLGADVHTSAVFIILIISKYNALVIQTYCDTSPQKFALHITAIHRSIHVLKCGVPVEFQSGSSNVVPFYNAVRTHT